VGRKTNANGSISDCYWLDLSGASLSPASTGYGIGNDTGNTTDAMRFNNVANWPTSIPSRNWGGRSDADGQNGYYWKDLGRWINGNYGRNSNFPVLYWQ
jgi:hypothetical protein